MRITPIKTRVLTPPQDDLEGVMTEALPSLSEQVIVAASSKVVSIWQGRCVPASEVEDKDQLAIEEAEQYLPRGEVPGGYVLHTLKHNLLISSSGVDASNGDGYFILWPAEPYKAAQKLRAFLQERYGVSEVGIIITDSHSVPLRRGSIGVSLGYAGFRPLRDYRGEEDLFGREMRASQANIADGLAATAVVAMGEGAEATPLALIEEAAADLFDGQGSAADTPFSSFEVPKEEDIFYPLIDHLDWQTGGSSDS